ncbi:hypothetical protein KKD88_02545 [Patescibacteria group bacterium]|nr:hypothetical protein [Patescibacteria group bacterium]MBU1034796.1 hypothetical protein [Patescibacteria group bacterium]MBU1629932.1 hypothetical protein [Patescibacteria group bacterium]
MIKPRTTSGAIRPKRAKSAASAKNKPKILSLDEKRELILAHTRARRPLDATQKVSMWAGVIVCSVFVALFWLYATNDGITRALAEPRDETVTAVLKSGAEITDVLDSGGEQFKEINSEIETVVGQLEAKLQEEAILEQIGSRLKDSSGNADLFAPQAGRLDD